MKIVTARRISQGFFVIVFLWFCVVATLGEKWWQLRGWPVNWVIQLDPLVGLGTLLTTHTLYAGLLWGLATVVLTIILGRFFCSWVCPFGAIHHFTGFLAHRRRSAIDRAKINRYRKTQSIKYWLLIFLLTAAAIHLIFHVKSFQRSELGILVIVFLAGTALLSMLKVIASPKKAVFFLFIFMGAWIILGLFFPGGRLVAISLQTGLFDPIPLLHRSVNLVLLPVLDASFQKISANARHYEGAWLIGAIFLTAIFLNMRVPRFYCRFICPLGALLGVLGRFALWKIGKTETECSNCLLCEANCEGACEPSGEIRISECVLCMNCLHTCEHDLIGYRTSSSASGEILSPDLNRREFVTSLISGAAAIPLLRMDGHLSDNWHPKVIRPPGALSEEEFLSRCIKCGQCMRICPTNIIHPAGLVAGLEGLWTPMLNFRIGTSGCQLNCVACGHLCPTAAIRPISLEEKLGSNQFAVRGPIRLGTAFVDRGRCLPWAMDRPCIVCQENCPVSPKAIITRDHFSTVRTDMVFRVKTADSLHIEIEGERLEPDRFSTGDYFCKLQGQPDNRPRLIVDNSSTSLTVSSGLPWDPPPSPGDRVEIQIRLQQPFVDPERCIGCGICEHECPVRGRRAIRVTAENESRSRKHAMLL